MLFERFSLITWSSTFSDGEAEEKEEPKETEPKKIRGRPKGKATKDEAAASKDNGDHGDLSGKPLH